VSDWCEVCAIFARSDVFKNEVTFFNERLSSFSNLDSWGVLTGIIERIFFFKEVNIAVS
jgi:hypothetical protein